MAGLGCFYSDIKGNPRDFDCLFEAEGGLHLDIHLALAGKIACSCGCLFEMLGAGLT